MESTASKLKAGMVAMLAFLAVPLTLILSTTNVAVNSHAQTKLAATPTPVCSVTLQTYQLVDHCVADKTIGYRQISFTCTDGAPTTYKTTLCTPDVQLVKTATTMCAYRNPSCRPQ